MQQGKFVFLVRNKIGIAKKLKELGLGMDTISESTGLTLEEIAEL